MKYWIAFLIFLSSSTLATACGPWYPYGEETRFSLLYPGWFDNGGLSEFYYSADVTAEYYEISSENDKNTLDWWNLIDQAVDKELVFHTIYSLSSKEVIDGENQPMIKALLDKKGKPYIDYLVFAKSYSHLNNSGNYWERNDKQEDSLRNVAAQIAVKNANNTTDEWLKRRYAFLALRFHFYSNNKAKVIELYDRYFDGKSEWAIDRWAEYHRLHFKEDSYQRNYRVAQLFSSVHSKRNGLWNLYNTKINQERVLDLAATNHEKANVHAMYILRETGKTLNELKTIYQLDPSNELLSFYVIREVNKLENWVLGPEITAYQPVIRDYDYDYNINDKIMKERIEEDRLYAKEFLDWLSVTAINMNSEVRSASIAILSLIVKDPKNGIKQLEKETFSSVELKNWKSNMLTLLKARDSKSPKLESYDLESFLKTDYRNKNAFIFALGREFEFNGDLSAAIMLYSHLNDKGNYDSFTWHESNGRTAYNLDFYYDSFDYFDANYSASEIENSWKKIENHKDSLLSELVLKDKLNWLDMIGTKYLREENLEKSIAVWEIIPNEYWFSEARNYDDYLQANPFYANFYSGHEETVGDTVSFTKLEIAQELQSRIKQSKRLKGDAKAKVLFGIANCYFNMTQHGNSWMMKRYYWSINFENTIYADDLDYNTCINAKKYYLLAKEAAKSKDFQALTLRMAGRCESIRIKFESNRNFDRDKYDSYADFVYYSNKYYNQIKANYPDVQEELLTNCLSFERYYQSIK
ncbi:hypothetical protein ERX46_04075 [Brumimicrobium glaciale]|uniref:Tetratricopeptide repeat protein n=1 Tax=Brumimicrobium glaciale TaxID=200475 RepID=A0A4Q4KRD1_9FLAO|nr:hypothetical protein [Brumimicrobium glaciale]RYM34559.1 hypothetical protein ERX46_04075 [Brumimicrobium glaciale]